METELYMGTEPNSFSSADVKEKCKYSQTPFSTHDGPLLRGPAPAFLWSVLMD